MLHRPIMPNVRSKRDVFVAVAGDTCRGEQHNLTKRLFVSLAEARHPALTRSVHPAANLVRILVQPKHGRDEVAMLARISRRYVSCEFDAEIAERARPRITGVLPFDRAGTP